MVKKKSKKFNMNLKRKFDDPWRYFYSFLIAIFLMAFGFLASYSMSTYGSDRLSSFQEDVFYNFYEKQIIQNYLLDLDKCDPDYYEEISEALDFQGGMLNELEIQFGIEDKGVLDKKENYFLLQLSHYNFVKEINEECSFNKNFILFFYSNKEEDLTDSEKVGRILSSLKSMDDSVMIYSFDVNFQNNLMKILRSYYNIDEGEMAIVINEDIKLDNIKNIDEILKFLN